MLTDSLIVLQQNPLFFYLTVTAFALCIGSFLNVAIYRIPIMLDLEWQTLVNQVSEQRVGRQNEFNLFLPGSHCPNCKQEIPFWANIPVISYLLLLGKSTCCQTKISARYPTIELLCTALTLFCAYHFGFSWQAFSASVFGWALLVLIVIDIDNMLLPDMITIPLLWVGLYTSIFNLFTNSNDAIIGAMAGYFTFWSIAWIFKRFRGIDGIGQGDYKLLAVLGAWLGWQQLPLIIMLSSLIGAIWGIFTIILTKSDTQTPIPFGPFLAIAGLIAMFWGHDIVSKYLSLYLLV